jgi:oligopeptide transport system substrate-binding protein
VTARLKPWLAALALGVAALLGACDSGGGRQACPAGKLCLEYGNIADPLSLDPNKTTSIQEDVILGNVFMGLAQHDAEGRPVPGMATAWETSADGLVWTFHLRQDAMWSDGVPLTAEDFVFSLRRVLDPATASETASLLYFIKNAQPVNEGRMKPAAVGVTALDAHTLQIRLEHPAPYFPQLLTHQAMYPVPEHIVARYGERWASGGHFVSNGPYVIESWKMGDRVHLVRNRRFYDDAKTCIDEIDFYPTTDSISAERRVRRGELDINDDIQSNRIAYLRRPGQMPAYVHTHAWLGVAYLAFNGRQAPALRDRRVRQALSMAIDRDFIARKLLRGGQIPAFSFVPPGIANYVPGGVKPYWGDWPLARRQAEARRLLAAAGYGPARPLKLELKHRNSADPMLFMPAIQADMKDIGVQVQLVQNESQIAYAAYRARDFQIADAAWIADYNDPLSFLYLQRSTTGGQNYSDYANPAYDALLDRADHEPDAARRAAYLARAEKMMLEDAPVAPVFFYVSKNLVSPAVTGWVDNLADWHRARYLCFKDAAARRAGKR